jgi:two-component system OmpR family response regulator
MRILLVEDDPLIGEALGQALRDASYTLDWVQDGQLGLAAAKSHEYSVMLLDLGLPRKSGFEVLASLRNSQNKLPTIIVTARDQVEDRIKGLDLGADDYLVKPFSVSELQARIRAVTRRSQGNACSILTCGDLSLDEASAVVTQYDENFSLSAREFTLLRLLMKRPGKIYSRSELEDQIYGWGEEVASNAIEFIIHGLRKKLGKKTIKNIRGLGWMVSK